MRMRRANLATCMLFAAGCSVIVICATCCSVTTSGSQRADVPAVTCLPDGPPKGDRVRIQGAVRYPGDFPVLQYWTILGAIDVAGGSTAKASAVRVRIKRRTGEEVVCDTEAQMANELLYPGDTATVELRGDDS